jgi:hypothetical protein
MVHLVMDTQPSQYGYQAEGWTATLLRHHLETTEGMERPCGYIQSPPPVECLRKAGVFSGNFWLATYSFLRNNLILKSPGT